MTTFKQFLKESEQEEDTTDDSKLIFEYIMPTLKAQGFKMSKEQPQPYPGKHTTTH